MAKPYSVSAVLPNGKTFYVATFRNSRGDRVSRGLGTPEHARAKTICAGLEELWLNKVKSAADAVLVDKKASELYFGLESTNEPEMHGSKIADPLASVRKHLEQFPKAVREKLLPVLLDRERLHREGEQQRLEIASLKRELKAVREDLQAVERDMVSQGKARAKDMKPIAAAVADFTQHMKSTTTDFNTKVVLSVVNRFIASLPAGRITLADVTAGDVSSFLDAEVSKGSEHKRLSRRNALRRRVGRLLNWHAQLKHYPSQMLAVNGESKDALDRESGEIHYHELADVKAAVKNLPDAYWKTLVSTLAYAGLQLAELCWLQVSDVHIAADGKSGFLSVTTVKDGDEKHLLKTSHRKRKVNIHPTLLLPLIKEHLKNGAGKMYLFPMPKELQVIEGRERWRVDSLSGKLRGHNGGKRRKPTPALLPKGMNAKSLRRTFGSLMIRSGKSEEETAAAMGNTADVVRKHYGKIRGHEVKVNF